MLIDGHSILNRAFYGLPELTDSKGRHTNAVLGFLNIMLKIMDEEKPTHLFVAFDVHEPTFRHKMYAEYKGTRKGMPEELREQVPLIKEVLHSRNYNPDIKNLVNGVMIESYIEDGAQKIGEGVYGKSITDPCLGWEKTESLIRLIAELL